MTLLSKIRLSAKFGGSVYLVSAIFTLVAVGVVIIFSPADLTFGIIIKLISIPLIFLLNNSLSRQQDMYFYLNLGISRNEYYIIPYAVDLAAFILLMIISCVIANAI